MTSGQPKTFRPTTGLKGCLTKAGFVVCAMVSGMTLAGSGCLGTQVGPPKEEKGPDVVVGENLEIKGLREELKALQERLDKLERLRGIAHYRFPRDVELLGQKIPLERKDLWERMDREFLLIVNDVPQVLLWMKRANRYFPFVEERIKAKGLPADLKYVAIVESSLRPEARSSAGALGIWQFMPATGSLYNLEINDWVDERQDPYRSTEAALSYLQYLFGKFNDWILAVAAYNGGEDRIRREMERQGVTSFYDLVLPSETERYVFRMAAAKVILSNPFAYGFELPQDELYEPSNAKPLEVFLERDVDLIQVARSCGMTYRLLRTLNPHLKESRLPRGKYRIYVPPEKTQEVLDALKRPFALAVGPSKERPPSSPPKAQGKRSSGSEAVHTVKQGETLWDIARSYGVPIKAIQRWNQLSESQKIKPGQRLVIYKDDRGSGS